MCVLSELAQPAAIQQGARDLGGACTINDKGALRRDGLVTVQVKLPLHTLCDLYMPYRHILISRELHTTKKVQLLMRSGKVE
jgi:hypothetical protein